MSQKIQELNYKLITFNKRFDVFLCKLADVIL